MPPSPGPTGGPQEFTLSRSKQQGERNASLPGVAANSPVFAWPPVLPLNRKKKGEEGRKQLSIKKRKRRNRTICKTIRSRVRKEKEKNNRNNKDTRWNKAMTDPSAMREKRRS